MSGVRGDSDAGQGDEWGNGFAATPDSPQDIPHETETDLVRQVKTELDFWSIIKRLRLRDHSEDFSPETSERLAESRPN